MLKEAIQAALYDKDIRADDMEFYSASKGWAECVAVGNMAAYQKRFEETAEFFKERYVIDSCSRMSVLELIVPYTFVGSRKVLELEMK